MPMSSADSLQTLPPTSRVPSGPVRLVKALYNPTYLAILASVGIHGLAVAALPVVGPMVSGGQQTPQGPRETQILKLTRAEANRLRSAFPAPKTTVLPPGLPSFNPNSTASKSFSPPPLSGDLSQSKSGRGWANIFGGNPSSETSEAADDSSRVASTGYTGESEGTFGESYDYSGESDAATGNGNSYPPEGYPDFSGMVGSPPPSNDRATPDKTPAKRPQNQQASNPGKTPDDRSENREPANADRNDNNANLPQSNAIALETIPGMRTGQSAIQNLEGDYQVRIVVDPNGSVGWELLEDNKLAEGAIEYTFNKTPPVVPSEPGEYILIVAYPAPESETTSDVAEENPTSPAEIPSDNLELLAFQEANPEYETIALDPVNIPSPVSGRAQVAVAVNKDGDVQVTLLEGTGNEELDLQAIEAARAGWTPVEEPTIQTFEVQFNTPDSSQPQTEEPTLQQAPTPDTPNPESTPEPSGESNSAPIPKPTTNPSDESTPEPTSGTEETVDSNSSTEPESSPENTEEDSTEEMPDEPSSSKIPPKQKPQLDPQSALPSL
jgi:hypothetical protein